MKKKILFLFMMGLLSLQPSSSVIAQTVNNFPIIVQDDPEDPTLPAHPHRSPAMMDVVAFFIPDSGTLNIEICPDIEVEQILIYKDGILVIEDDDVLLTYYLSTFGMGSYEVVVITTEDVIFCGNLNIE